MEGGLLPWKSQSIDGHYPDLDSFGKPLPPPPADLRWEQQSDGSWALQSRSEVGNPQGLTKADKPTVIEHIVMPQDTLAGLSLRYRVPVAAIRKLNMFSGDRIHFKKSLLIPIDPGVTFVAQLNTEEVKLQRFRNATGEATEEARLYLSDHDWDVDKAIEAWKNDEQWVADEGPIPTVAPNLAVSAAFSSEVGELVVAPLSVESTREVAPFAISTTYPVALVYSEEDDSILQPLLA